jgi:hypothetical protein
MLIRRCWPVFSADVSVLVCQVDCGLTLRCAREPAVVIVVLQLVVFVMYGWANDYVLHRLEYQVPRLFGLRLLADDDTAKGVLRCGGGRGGSCTVACVANRHTLTPGADAASCCTLQHDLASHAVGLVRACRSRCCDVLCFPRSCSVVWCWCCVMFVRLSFYSCVKCPFLHWFLHRFC